MKKILLLGAQGLLGQSLMAVFKDDFQVIALDLADLDVTDEGRVMKRITDEKPDYIINATGYNGVDQAETEPGKTFAFKINGDAVGFIAKAGEKNGSVTIHFSSDYVFAGDKKEGYDESADTSPLNAYGKSKESGEKQLMLGTKRFYLVRLSKLFGPPAASALAKKSFVDLIVERAKVQSEVRVVDEEVSCPTYSRDLAVFVRGLVDSDKPFGIYHGANSGACTWYEFTKEIFHIKKISAKIVKVPGEEFKRDAKRPQYSKLNNTKLPLQRSWQEALKEYLAD